MNADAILATFEQRAQLGAISDLDYDLAAMPDVPLVAGIRSDCQVLKLTLKGKT